MEKIFQTIWEMSLFAVPVILILAICSNLLGKRYGARWRYDKRRYVGIFG